MQAVAKLPRQLINGAATWDEEQPSTGWTKHAAPSAALYVRREEKNGRSDWRGEERREWHDEQWRVSRQSGRKIADIRHSRDRLIARGTSNVSSRTCR